MPSPSDHLQPCLFVVGMHRSGTSAVTGSLTALGLAGPVEDTRISASAWNERGNFESRPLRTFNDELLASLGGTWSGPPALVPGWETDPALDSWRTRGRHTLDRTFPSRPMVWKDPRNCLTLPFWRTVVHPPVAAVFVHRDPVEVARSLQARHGVSLTFGLALWDRYVRSACTHLAGLPTLATDYARVLEHPSAWITEAADFLAGLGVPVASPSDPAVGASVAGDLRHHDASLDQRPRLADSQYEMLETVRRHDGAHQAWMAPDLGTAPPWVDDVLALRLRTDNLRDDLHRARNLSERSRVFRLTRSLGNLRPGARTSDPTRR